MTDELTDDEIRQSYARTDMNGIPNHPDLPEKPYIWLVIGRTGSGKTEYITNEIIKGHLTFTKLYVYAEAIEEDKYSNLIDAMIYSAKQQNMDPNDLIVADSDPKNIVNPTELDKAKDNLVIFDDFYNNATATPHVITHFKRGRKQNANYVFFTQSWTGTHLDIRRQANVVTMFGALSTNDLREIQKTFAPSMDFKTEFLPIYAQATKAKYDSWTLTRGTQLDHEDQPMDQLIKK